MKLPIAALLAATLWLVPAAQPLLCMEQGTQEKPDKTDLKPGEYVWQPEAAPQGAVDIIVSLRKQLLWAYRDGVLVGRSTISSGRKDFETPKGVYMVLQKNVTHHSNTYHEASMPYMLRLTWKGLAIHAGNTPGHPESHGCMHVPEEFAKKLYGIAEEGGTVLVADDETPPAPAPGVDRLFADTPADAHAPAASPAASPAGTPAFVWKPEEVVKGAFLIVVSSADKRVYVYRKGIEVGRADLEGPDAGKGHGKHVYVALDPKKDGGLGGWTFLGRADGSPAPDFKRLAESMRMPAEFRQKVRGIIAPSTTLVLTDEGADNAKREGPEIED